MKFLVLLCLLGVFTASFANAHKASKLGQAFQAFIDLADGDDEVNKVAAILNEVEAELQADYDSISGQYNGLQTQFDADHEAAIEYRETGNAELATADTNIDSIKVVIDELTDAISISLDAINNANSQIDALNAQREADHAAFEERSGALQKAIEAAQEALQLVIEVSEQDLGASFLQINNQKITKQFHAISHKLNKKNVGQLSTTMAQLLADATADGINAEVAGQLVDLIERLIETLSAELDSATAQENAQIDETNSAVAGYETVKANESASASGNQDALTLNEEELVAWVAYRDDVNYWIDYYEAAWEEHKANIEAQFANYDALLKRLRKDMNSLDAAKEILASQ